MIQKMTSGLRVHPAAKLLATPMTARRARFVLGWVIVRRVELRSRPGV